jgi:hypothetical protein
MLSLRTKSTNKEGKEVSNKAVKREVNESYIFFCDNFLKCVVGLHKFNRSIKNTHKLRHIATPSDEALALLLLENSEYRWNQEFERKKKGEDVNEDHLPPTMYTSLGQNKQQKGFTRKYGGWSQAGIHRFNELVKKVRDDREKNGKWFDNILKQRALAEQQDDDNVPGPNNNNAVKAENDLLFCLGKANKKKKKDGESSSSEDEEDDEDEDEEDDDNNDDDGEIRNVEAV